MNRRTNLSGSSFTGKERNLIRRELERRFGQEPSIADGIMLRTRATGEHRGQPKIPPEVQSMSNRGLVEIRSDNWRARAFFTEAGIRELGILLRDRREMDAKRFAHLRRELGVVDDYGGPVD